MPRDYARAALAYMQANGLWWAFDARGELVTVEECEQALAEYRQVTSV